MSDFRPTGFQIMPPVVKNLLIINSIMFIVDQLLQQTSRVNLTQLLGMHYFTAEDFKPHQIVTHIFMHGGFSHILFNMFTLWMFGSMLENFWGPKKFLVFYMVCGIGASLTHLTYTGYKLWPAFQFNETGSLVDFRELVDRNSALLYAASKDPNNADYAPAELIELSNQAEKKPGDPFLQETIRVKVSSIQSAVEGRPTVGASGAIYGLLMAFGMIFPNMVLRLYFLFPMKAKHFVILMIAIGLFFGFAEFEGDNIAHFAHLGGMAFGFLMIQFWQRGKPRPFN